MGSGGLAFVLTAGLAAAVFWFAPVNPCRSLDRTSFCSGETLYSGESYTRTWDPAPSGLDFAIKAGLAFSPGPMALVGLLIGAQIASRRQRSARARIASTPAAEARSSS